MSACRTVSPALVMLQVFQRVAFPTRFALLFFITMHFFVLFRYTLQEVTCLELSFKLLKSSYLRITALRVRASFRSFQMLT